MDIARVIRFWLTGMMLLTLSSVALAMPPKRITVQEKALLPPYCKFTQGGYVGHENPQQPTDGAKRWVNIFGRQGNTANLWRMHHYCYALIHMMRGQRTGLTLMEFKEAWLGTIEEIDYTLQFLPDDFVLMPEMLLNRGRALVRLKKAEAALENFRKATELKPDYWPPYLEMAEILTAAKDKSGAIEVLQKGLQNAPDAKALRLRLTQLGGKIPSVSLEAGPAQVPVISEEQPLSNPAEKPAPGND